MTRSHYLRLAWSHLREFRGLFLAAIAILVLASVFELGGVALVLPLLEQMGAATSDSPVSRYALAVVARLGISDPFIGVLTLFVILVLAKFALMEWATYTGRVLSSVLRYRMRQRIFDNLMDLPLSFFYRRKVGDLIASTDTSTTEAAALVENAVRLLNVLLFAGVYLTVQLMVSVWMTVAVFLLTALAYYMASPRFARQFTQGEEAKRLYDETASFLQDRIAGIKLIKAFGNSAIHRQEFDRLGTALMNLAINIQRNKVVAHAFGEPFTTVAVVVMLLLAVRVFQLNVVELLTFFYAYSLLVPRVKSLTSEVLTIVEKLPHFEKANELIERHDKVYLTEGALEFDGLQSDIEFAGVSFSYGQGLPTVLKGIRLTLPRMKATALVGPSGVGKTTVADLVLRLHDPTGGAVLVNGRDLRDYTRSSWHRMIAVVEQDPFLFHDTVLSNIRYGRPDATIDEVRAAATQAHADTFISALPEGYDTVVGQRGITLSGGQRQRIALARALVRRPDVLVLDEATSALDSESERFIQEAIEAIRNTCTLVIIAHRLSTIASADVIVILDGGSVAEQGTHQELISRKGLYARYYNLQTSQVSAQENVSGLTYGTNV